LKKERLRFNLKFGNFACSEIRIQNSGGLPVTAAGPRKNQNGEAENHDFTGK